MKKIIGIDPGLAATGIGIVSGKGVKIESFAFGSINTCANDSMQNRLGHIFGQILSVLKNEKPDLMVIEDVFFMPKYPKSGITLGKVSGVVLLAGSQLDVPAEEVTVREVKQVLTGNGSASKVQLEMAVRHLLNMKTPIRPYHASDAMALALIGLYRLI